MIGVLIKGDKKGGESDDELAVLLSNPIPPRKS